MKKWLVIFATLIMVSCQSHHFLADENFSYMYDGGEGTLRPYMNVYIDSSGTTLIRVLVDKEHLQFKEDVRQGGANASMRMEFFIYEGYEAGEFIDSSSVLFEEIQPGTPRFITKTFTLSPDFPKRSYLAVVRIYDFHAKKKVKQVHAFHTGTPHAPETFRFYRLNNNRVYFRNWFN